MCLFFSKKLEQFQIEWIYLSPGHHWSQPSKWFSCLFDSMPGYEEPFGTQTLFCETKPRDKWLSGATMTAETVQPVTLMPAERHLPTASGTAARGGSIMEMRPRKQSCSVGKFGSSQLKLKPRGNWEEDRFKWQKPGREGEKRIWQEKDVVFIICPVKSSM